MDIYWFGQTSFKIKCKQAAVLVDPKKETEADAILLTQKEGEVFNEAESGLVISGPGEYETKGINIKGISLGDGILYLIEEKKLSVVLTGKAGNKLSEQDVDEVGDCDILMVPAQGAQDMISKLEPKIIIPIYEDGGSLDSFLKEMGVDSAQPQPKLSITKDKLPEEPKVIVLSKP